MPLFSIVIPTTRIRLLPEALVSALAQDFSDYEIVISDNSDEGCESILAAFDSDIIRCVRPTEYMTVTKHWDFALSHARGDWVLMLCDDDALVPNALSIIYSAIQRYPDVGSVFWPKASYDDHNESNRTLCVPGYKGDCIKESSAEKIEMMFQSGTGFFRVKYNLPFFPLAAISKSVLDETRRINEGALFQPPCPMASGALFTLAFSNTAARMDLPLTVLGQPEDSAGGMIKSSAAYNRMHKDVSLEYTPIKTMTVFPAVSAESLLRAHSVLKHNFSLPDLNYANYFLACYYAISELEIGGWDGKKERSLFDQSLATFPEATQKAVKALIAQDEEGEEVSLPGQLVALVMRIGKGLGRRLSGGRNTIDHVLDGVECGFDSISGAAMTLGREFPKNKIVN